MQYFTSYWQIIFVSILFVITLIPTLLSALTLKKNKNVKYNCSQLPQPRGALPFIGHLHLLGGKQTIARTLGAMADECGPIYLLRLGQQRAVVLCSWEMIKECFTNNDAITATRLNLAFSKHVAYDYAAFAMSPYGKYWRDIRKISTVELLSNKRLEQMKHVRNDEINSFIKYLFKECHKHVKHNTLQSGMISLCKWFEYNSFNLIIRMIVGKTFSPDEYEKNGTLPSRFKKLIGKATYFAGVSVPSDFLTWLEWFDFMGYIKCMKDVHNGVDMIIGHWVDEHIQRRKEYENGGYEDCDFMDVLLSNIGEAVKDVSCPATLESREVVIKATSMILLLTGSESTSITLSWVVSLLLNHPEALKKAQEELDHNVGKERWVEESDIPNLTYVRAIVKETLRLYPPAPLSGQREASEDCYIDGHLIPKGTRILVDIWKIHRDPRVWSRPNDFRPERFLVENTSIDYKGVCFEYIPFSLGRRACPGMTFGLQVVHLTLARLIQGFDIRAEKSGPIDMSEALGLALPRKSPLHVILATRMPVEMYDAM